MTMPKSKIALLRQPTFLFALGFGVGLIPKAPGTFGTLVALPFLALLMLAPPYYLMIVTALCFILGIIVCDACAKELGEHDHPSIVWDEVVGMFVTMLLVPLTWSNIFLGFILFRFFDILKPWPIRWLDKHVHGGLGIMLDDMAAGGISAILLFVIHHYI